MEKLYNNKELKELENNEKAFLIQKNLNEKESIPISNNFNKIYAEKEFEVLTDGIKYWISLDDMNEIGRALPKNLHILFQDLQVDNEVVLGKIYLRISLEQVKLINKYTFDPKYVPRLRLIMERDPRERADGFEGPSMSR